GGGGAAGGGGCPGAGGRTPPGACLRFRGDRRSDPPPPFAPPWRGGGPRLDNGLGVILLRDPAAPVVAYQTWFRVGSRHEAAGKTGISHLFEHLMFNQTENLPAGEFDRQMGAARGGNNSAPRGGWTGFPRSPPAATAEVGGRP